MASTTLGLQNSQPPPLDTQINRWFRSYCRPGYASFTFPPFSTNPFNKIQPHLSDCTFFPKLNTCSCILFFLVSKFNKKGAKEHIVYEWKDTGKWSGEEWVRDYDRLNGKQGLVWKFKECVWREGLSDARFERIIGWVIDVADFPAEPF